MALDPEPTHVIAHLSDTHLLAGGAPLHGVDTVRNLRLALDRLVASGIRVDAIVHTGDVADLGEGDAYRRVAELVRPVAEQLHCPVVWVAGNHDLRAPMRRELLGVAGSDDPLDSSVTVRGLRIVALDTSVPGHGHGELEPRQLDWLRDQLADPAPHGTVLALHHPPVPTVVNELQLLQLRHVDALAEAIEGRDVRAILAGHFHYPTSGTLAGVPVHVTTATSYTIRLDGPARGLTGVDGAQGLGLLHLYPRSQPSLPSALHATIGLAGHPEIVHLPHGFFETGPGRGTI